MESDGDRVRKPSRSKPDPKPRIVRSTSPFKTAPRNTILIGEATEQLRRLPSGSVDACITSPPYFAVRDYSTPGQIGLEANVDEWVQALRPMFAELARVLKPKGSVWVNIDDTFASALRRGGPTRSMLLAPERLLIALAADGWLTRAKVVWAKPNPLPHALTDRTNHTYEMCFMITRSRSYYFDLDSIRMPYRVDANGSPVAVGWSTEVSGSPHYLFGKDPGDVWTIPTKGFRGAHFATFPEALIERPLLASCPERVCEECGAPWRREVRVHIVGEKGSAKRTDPYVARFAGHWRTYRRLGPLKASCGCKARWKAGLVLDPFMGANTTGLVSERLGRDWLGIELSPAYAKIATERLAAARSRTSEKAAA
jgi:DNA modification methylase